MSKKNGTKRQSSKRAGFWHKIGSPSGEGVSTDAEKRAIRERLNDIGRRVDTLEHSRSEKVPVS